jgi:hypothetical protein
VLRGVKCLREKLVLCYRDDSDYSFRHSNKLLLYKPNDTPPNDIP